MRKRFDIMKCIQVIIKELNLKDQKIQFRTMGLNHCKVYDFQNLTMKIKSICLRKEIIYNLRRIFLIKKIAWIRK
jgi:hypothetical protein